MTCRRAPSGATPRLRARVDFGVFFGVLALLLWLTVSLAPEAHATAGSIPAPPDNATVTRLTDGSYRLDWINPATQNDGSPLDDFGGIKIYRNGFLLVAVSRPAGMAGQPDTFTDTTAPTSVYWTLSAFDREPAHNESVQTARISTAPPPPPQPMLTVTPTRLDFAMILNELAAQQQLEIRNVGTGTLDVTLAEGAAWLSLDRVAGSIPAGAGLIITVVVDHTGLARGSYAENIIMTSNDPAHPTTIILVYLTVGGAFQVDASPIQFAAVRHAPLIQLSRPLLNAGLTPIHFTAATSAPWAVVFPAAGNIPGRGSIALDLAVGSEILGPGSYADSLIITSNDPLLPRVVIPLRLDLTVVPADIQLTPSTLVFSVLREAAPQTRLASVSNAGYELLQVTSVTHGAAWLDVPALNATLGHGSISALSVRARPAGLAVGVYRDTIFVASDDADAPLAPLPVVLTVSTTPPQLTVSPATLSASTTTGGAPIDLNLRLTNGGNEALDYAIATSVAWATVLPATPGSVPRGGATNVTVRLLPAGLPPGAYSTNVTLTSNDPAHSTVAIPVSLQVVESPHLRLEPDTLAFQIALTGSGQQNLTLRNTGGLPLVWSVAQGAPNVSLGNTGGTIAAGGSFVTRVSVTPPAGGSGRYAIPIAISTNDPGHPVSTLLIDLSVAPAQYSVTPSAINVTLPWGNPAVTRWIVLRNGGPGSLTVSLQGGTPWLTLDTPGISFTVAAGDSHAFALTLNTQFLAPATYSTTLGLDISGAPGTLSIPVSLSLFAGPPHIGAEPIPLTFQRTIGSAAQWLSLTITNSAWQTLHYQISSTAPWLSVSAGPGSVGRGDMAYAYVRADPRGLAAGHYTSSLVVTSDDPDTPTLPVLVTLEVRPRFLETAPVGMAMEELGLRCAGGDSTVRFIELTCLATGGCTFQGSTGLRATDRHGTALFDVTHLFPTRGDGQPWPAGTSWLIGSAELAAAAGLTPDHTLPLPLDPLGGVLTLYDGAGTTLHAFAYGAAGGVNAPEPGHTLQLQPGGQMLEAQPPNPRNAAGLSSPGFDCPCPTNLLNAGSSTLITRAAAFALSGHGDNPGGLAYDRYDLIAGDASVSGNHAYGDIQNSDVYYVGGVTAGAPVHFFARLHFEMSMDAQPPFVRFSSAVAGLRSHAGPWLLFSRSVSYSREPHSISSNGNLVLPLSVRALEAFGIDTKVGAGGGSEGGSASCVTQLDFFGLPPGATLNSCQGFSRLVPTPIELALIEAVAEPGRVRIAWRAPADLRGATVYRRDAATHWAALGLIRPGAGDRLTFIDDRVTPGTTYDYRLGIDGEMVGLVTVNVPTSAADLALQLPGRLAYARALPLEFDLPVTAATRVELFDIQGRRLATRDLDDGARGHHHLDWSPGTPIASGLYLVRLTQMSRSVVARVTVVH